MGNYINGYIYEHKMYLHINQYTKPFIQPHFVSMSVLKPRFRRVRYLKIIQYITPLIYVPFYFV